MKMLIMAGEVSGDYQASFLVRALRARLPDIELAGTGGAHMKEAGVELSHEMAHLSSVGFLEPIRHVLPLRGIYRDITRLVREERPDLAVLVDNQGFNLAIGKVLHSLGVPVVFYFPPQIWVGAGLFAPSVARIGRVVISAFPREAEIYRDRYRANAVSYGHPLLDIVRTSADPDGALRRAGLDPSRPLMGLMPGSRRQEVKELGSAMLEAAAVVKRRLPSMQFALPLADEYMREPVRRLLDESGMTRDVALVGGGAYDLLSRCSVVLTCSGTATLELALLRVPMVVTYRLDPVSHWFARKLAVTPHVAMPNVLLEDRVVPEIMQYRMTGGHFAEHALEILENPAKSAEIRRRLAEIPAHLGEHGAVGRAADRIVEEALAATGVRREKAAHV